MKKSIKIRCCTMLFMLLCSTSSLFSTTPPTPYIYYSGNGTGSYAFQLVNEPSGVSSAFWVLGDGHFRWGKKISNHDMVDGTNNQVQAYMLEPYKINPPSKIVCGNCNTSTVTNTPNNPKMAMSFGQYLKTGTSWNPAMGEMHYTLLSFMNFGLLYNGRIRLNFQNITPSTSLIIDPLENNGNWINSHSINGNILQLNFSGLGYLEQRYVLIQTNVPNNPYLESINYLASIETPGGDIINQAFVRDTIRKHPHDPNSKIVSEKYICSHDNQKTTLEYRIDFQNEGDYYAKDVLIEDVLPLGLDPNSFKFIASSHPCQPTPHPGNHTVSFFFEGIDLPGLAQHIPNLYPQEETKGYVIFSYETETCLEPMDIENEADIYFDALPPIRTSLAITSVVDRDYCYATRLECDWDEGDVGNDEVIRTDRRGPAGKENIDVYPNPFADELFIKVDFSAEDATLGRLAVFNMQGLMMVDLSDRIREVNKNEDWRIDTSDWPSGIYFVKLEGRKSTHTWKMIKIQDD